MAAALNPPVTSDEARESSARKDNTTGDGVRQRELYKYFTPPSSTSALPNPSSRFEVPDSVLTAHVQLAAWRLDCQRAMLSLIDGGTQYFIAEATKTLDIGGSGKSENEGDGLWLELACTAVPKAGRLCEYTIAQMPPVEGGIPYFEVTDLRQDERFRDLPFVTGSPGFRYYCGVPLRTKKGINIGSIFVLDTKPRQPATQVQCEVLAAMAGNCMTHLDMLRDKEAKQRALNMNLCLSAFVDPDRSVSKRKRGHARGSTAEQPHSATKSAPRPEQATESKPHTESRSAAKDVSRRSGSPTQSHRSERRTSAEDSSASDTDDEHTRRHVGEDEHLSTYQRAAELLRESLTIDNGGGVVFMAPSQEYKLATEAEDTSSDESPQDRSDSTRRGSAGHATIRSASSWAVRAQRKSVSADTALSTPCEVLASAYDGADPATPTGGFTPLATSAITKLVKRYPRGKLFSFDGDNQISSCESGDEPTSSSTDVLQRSRRVHASRGEVSMLVKHFPGSRQIIFIPLWDSTTSRWCACFSVNTCEFRYLRSADFLHNLAFGNCIMTEISRMATLTADQQKSDFIGSVSHELRSPLHGILASCEFLSETECDSFQKSLVDTADACARTLLDTLNMVLDYSKINHFERNLSKARKSRKDTTTATIAGQTPGLAPLLNIYGDVDLAIITEEVVEGVASGQSFKDSLNNVDTADLPPMSPITIRKSGSERSAAKAQVEIILDISSRDWTFVTQPGAFRRIVMNLFGNALKYTRRGFIRVKLETKDSPPTPDVSGNQSTNATSIVLTITDSGSGMSPEFMRTKLFTPFSQESPMNPGTGLGLSLVRSIVSMLNGNINIQSAVDVGTEVRVTLPMLRGASSGSAASSTPSSSGSSIERIKDDSVAVVKKESKGRTVSLFHQHHIDQTFGEKHAASMLSAATKHYVEDWYHFTVRDWSPEAPTDIIICAESDLQALAQKAPGIFSPEPTSAVLVLCTTASRHAVRSTVEGLDNAEALCHPFGPYKLAKSLRVCLGFLGHAAPAAADEPNIAAGAERGSPLVDEITETVQHVHLKNIRDIETPGVAVMQQGETLGNEESVGAQMALDSLPSKSSSADSEPKGEFPFPHPADPRDDGTTSPSHLPQQVVGLRPPLAERRTISATSQEMSHFESAHSSTPMSVIGAVTDKPPVGISAAPSKPSRAPRLLLVDDNRVNLRLLDTYMRKRKYDAITLAEDGAQAVAAFTAMITEDPPAPPDIVFMDISMPTMDGFEATRRIRDVEAEVRDKLTPMETPASALIIALTGLASGRDQSEAFTSGFDLYLTKPVSMREVGRLLTNWEANGGATTVGVPHGPLAAAENW